MSVRDPEEFVRFMRMVEIPLDLGACWTWQGNKPDGKYGHFSLGAKTVKAHRWLYETVIGPIPTGLVVRHKCDNPPCVNPMHLQIGTHSDNQKDKFLRGRGADRRGEKHPLARLTAEQVKDIRRMADCGHTHAYLAGLYGVKRGQIGKIVNRLNWRHI